MLEELPVLVIEDDLDIQALIDEALCDGGYQPALAASGEEAITLLKGRQAKYRVLVTDINLVGRIDGWEVGRCRRSMGRPRRANSILLAKPFAPAQLVTAISNLLNTGGPPTAPTE